MSQFDMSDLDTDLGQAPSIKPLKPKATLFQCRGHLSVDLGVLAGSSEVIAPRIDITMWLRLHSLHQIGSGITLS
jgi:hypothetical protein